MAVVAARQLRSPAFRRRTDVRRYRTRAVAVCAPMLAMLAGIVLAGSIEFAVDSGWLVVEGDNDVSLTEQGRDIVRKAFS